MADGQAVAGDGGDLALRIADSLYGAARYFEASIAYERVLFSGAEGPLGKERLFAAVTGKTRCLKQQAKFDQALGFLENWQTYPFPDSGQIEIHTQQVLCAYLGARFENVLSLVDRWPYLHGGRAPAPMLVVLKILALNELQRWDEASSVYHSFVKARLGSGGPVADTLTDLYAQVPKLKSVNKAQWLSQLIPGAGQFYAGKPGEALLSILVQGAGIYFTILSFQQHYYVSAWLIGAALFGAFHMGGVRRAEVLVQRYNRKRILAFNGKVREQLLGLLE